MIKAFFGTIGTAFKRFNDDRCFGYTIIISYFVLLCAAPLIALFAWITGRFLGSPEIAVRSLNIFSEEFFTRIAPGFFEGLAAVTKSTSHLGWFGVVGSLVSGSFLFSNVIGSINVVFRTKSAKSFFYNRLMEYIIMLIMALILLFSFAITVLWTAAHAALEKSVLVNDYLNPGVLPFFDNIFVQYFLPFALSFLVLFVLYKFIPEIKVHTRAATLSAAVGSVLLEIFKRIFVFYVANFSVVGAVMSKLVRGTLTSIIFFLLWLSFSLGIMLWCAELAAILNERIEARKALETADATGPAPAPGA